MVRFKRVCANTQLEVRALSCLFVPSAGNFHPKNRRTIPITRLRVWPATIVRLAGRGSEQTNEIDTPVCFDIPQPWRFAREGGDGSGAPRDSKTFKKGT